MPTKRTSAALAAGGLVVVSAIASALINELHSGWPWWVAAGAAVALWAIWTAIQATSASGDPGSKDPLGDAADELATATLGQWATAATARRVVAPEPVMVRWRWLNASSRGVGSGAAITGAGPTPLPPSYRSSTPSAPEGIVTELHDTVYENLSAGRMVLLGYAGAGKTSALVLLVLATLARRAGLRRRDRRAVPVPVWLTLNAWDPTQQSLRSWVTSTLHRDYPALRAHSEGGTLAEQLWDSRRLALYLDGLDEMTEDHRGPAIQQIERDAAALRLVLTSRDDAYTATRSTGRLHNVAEIRLLPVGVGTAITYLTTDVALDHEPQWRNVAATLQEYPNGAAARVLSSPFALGLAYRAYRDVDPTPLIAFDSEDGLRSFLIETALHTTYPDPDVFLPAVYWLSWLAEKLGTDTDIAWWRIADWAPSARASPSAAVGLLAGVGAGVGFDWTRGPLTASLTAAQLGIQGLVYAWQLKRHLANSGVPRTVRLTRPTPSTFRASALCSAVFGAIYWAGGTLLSSTRAGLLGLVLGVMLGIVMPWGIEQYSDVVDGHTTVRALTPRGAYHDDRVSQALIAIVSILGFAIFAGLYLVHADSSFLLAVTYGCCTGAFIAVTYLCFGPGPSTRLRRVERSLRNDLAGRPRFVDLLDRAAADGVLIRRVGATYQFRHVEIQRHLAKRHLAVDRTS